MGQEEVTFEQGRADALARTARRSEVQEYRLGYLDGLYERAQRTALRSFRDRTIGGLLFEVSASMSGEGFDWSVLDPDGASHTGGAIDMEHGIAACEGVARTLGQPCARLSAIMGSIDRLHPGLSDVERRRLAARTVEEIMSRGRVDA